MFYHLLAGNRSANGRIEADPAPSVKLGFALVIGMVGCYEGLLVSGSAESVGLRTTKSVVESIFLVIVLNAFFSVLFQIIHI